MLETYHTKGCLFLYKPAFSNEYHNLIKLIDEAKLQDKVKICIPEIVCAEMLHHAHDCFNSERKSLFDTLAKHEKTFGKLLKHTYELPEKYDLSIENLKENLCSYYEGICFIEYPTNASTLEILIQKSLASVSPFSKASKSGKEFSDAGFKDAILWEIITNYTVDDEDIVVLFTSDRNFSNIDGANSSISNYHIVHVFEDLKNLIEKKLKILVEDKIRTRFESDDYLIDTILSNLNISTPNSIVTIGDIAVAEGDSDEYLNFDEGNLHYVSLHIIFKGKKQTVRVLVVLQKVGQHSNTTKIDIICSHIKCFLVIGKLF